MNQPISEPEKEQYSSLILESRAAYDRLLRNEPTRKILQGLEIHDLYDAARLTRLFVVVASSANLGQVRSAPEIYDLYETLRSLARVEATCRALLEKEMIGEIAPTQGLVKLQIVDYDGQGIEPHRLEVIISILIRIHTDLARLLDDHKSKLRLAYFDSGSDVVVGITAATGLITALGALLLRFWDKYKFRNNETFGKDLESLTQGLDFLEKVHESVEKKAITDEEAKILTTQVFRGINDLHGLGASAPLRDTAAVNERQLLVEMRDVKLLGTGQASEGTGAAERVTRSLSSGIQQPLDPLRLAGNDLQISLGWPVRSRAPLLPVSQSAKGDMVAHGEFLLR